MPTKKTTKKPATKAKAFTGYEVCVRVNDVDFKSRGKTIKECLDQFVQSDEFPFGAKTPAVFNVKKGKTESTTRLYPQRARRMFLNMKRSPTVVESFAAQLDRRHNG